MGMIMNAAVSSVVLTIDLNRRSVVWTSEFGCHDRSIYRLPTLSLQCRAVIDRSLKNENFTFLIIKLMSD